jgi:hypothetical protein
LATIKEKKKKEKPVLGRVWRSWYPCVLLVGMSNGTAIVGDSMAAPQKIKNRITV